MRTFYPHLCNFFCVVSSLNFGQISPLAFFRWFTVTSDRNDESCNRIPSNYCLPLLLSIAPRFWPSKPLAGLGRIWNRYLLTMFSWNRRDSTPLAVAPQALKGDQGWSKWFQLKTITKIIVVWNFKLSHCHYSMRCSFWHLQHYFDHNFSTDAFFSLSPGV